MNPLVPVILGLAGAAISGLVAWKIAKGQRESVDEIALRADQREMRQELRGETITLREELVALRADAATARTESAGLRTELAALREESAATRVEMAALREESAALRGEVVGLRRQLAAEETGRNELSQKVEGLGTKLDEGKAP